MNSFFDRISYFMSYQSIVQYHLGSGKKIVIDRDKKICRFCGEGEPKTTFGNVAHAVPEFLGNGQLVSDSECDNCNTFFSESLEDHLDKYTKSFRTIAKIKGKKKVPSNKSRDKLTRFDVESNELAKIISHPIHGKSKIDTENNELTHEFEIEPYIPSSVYKCLVKMALTIIDSNELWNFSAVLNWITGKDENFGYPLYMYESFISGEKPYKNLNVAIFKKNEFVSTRPFYYFMVGFGNVNFQITIPSDDDLYILHTTKRFTKQCIPLIFELPPYGYSVSTKRIDLNNQSIVRNDSRVTKFSLGQCINLDSLRGASLSDLGYSEQYLAEAQAASLHKKSQ